MGQFTTGGLAQIVANGLDDLQISLAAFDGANQIGNTPTTTFSSVEYDFNSDEGTASVTFPETTITNIPQGTTIDKIEIRVGAGVVWEQTGLTIAFTSLGTLTIDGTFLLTGGDLTTRQKAAILKYGLAGRTGKLQLTGTSVPTDVETFFFGTAGPSGITQLSETVFNITATQQNQVTVTGVNVKVTFPDLGDVDFGDIVKSPALIYVANGTTTISSVRFQAINT